MHDVIVIGAGFSGIGFARHLKSCGIENFLVLEKATEPGGVWRENTYPGAACDAPSHLYSYSFHTNFLWSRRFAPQGEIFKYLNECVQRFELRPHMRFAQEVSSATWKEDSRAWHVEVADGTSYESRCLVFAVGQLNRPKVPRIPGAETFQGASFHSAEWRHDIDFHGKRVAVIGTGSSAIQLAPELAKIADQLVIYQRSPGYIRPKPELVYSKKQLAIFRALPMLRKLDRLKFYLQNEYRYTFFENPDKNKKAQSGFRAMLSTRIADPELRSKLTPDYSLGCKRGLPSNDWIPMLQRPNVDLDSAQIVEIRPGGIRTVNGTRDFDVIVYATGFQTTEFLEPISIRGRDGLLLKERWKTGAEAYLGLTVHGFPNMFILYGPNTNLGHTSVIYMLESQFRYVWKAIRRVLSKPGAAIEVRSEVERAYNDDLQRKLARSVMVQGGCTSWFKNEAGRVVNNWPGFSFLYRLRLARFAKRDYHLT